MRLQKRGKEPALSLYFLNAIDMCDLARCVDYKANRDSSRSC